MTHLMSHTGPPDRAEQLVEAEKTPELQRR